MYYIPFNSRQSYHKSPFGAVKTDTKVVFRIVLPRSMGCRAAFLVVDAKSLPMEWEAMQGENEEWWKVTFTPASEGIYRYHFSLNTDYGAQTILKYESSLGKIGADGGEWQLTVYSPDLKTPDWIKGSVIYQIFPDRFCFSGEEKQNVPDDRLLRNDWGGEPLWQPDKNGKIKQYDFFQGDFKGIEQKLGYLQSLGIGCIYLNPIFSAHSNHRYDTADYLAPDALLGTREDFKRLCDEAKKRGIRIILDGVFSHTGADSIYFNREKRYDTLGAYNSKASPYYSWYKFKHYPNKYTCWWGVDILPEITEENPDYLEFITGENGVLRYWQRIGAGGWRLDVADELPDVFLDALRDAVKSEAKDSYILGEVWEDASNKISYGSQRRYLLGSQLDSVMNYPFANALLHFAISGEAEGFNEKIYEIAENYPKPCVDTLMNHIGTHDTRRALTVLSGGDAPFEHLNRYRGAVDGDELERGKKLMRLISTAQYALPGVPCVYYGDEAGLCGGDDPFNRACYPWGKEDLSLIEHYRALGSIRSSHSVFASGEFAPVSCESGCVAFERRGEAESALLVANRNDVQIDYYLPAGEWQCLTANANLIGNVITLPALTAAILIKSNEVM